MGGGIWGLTSRLPVKMKTYSQELSWFFCNIHGYDCSKFLALRIALLLKMVLFQNKF